MTTKVYFSISKEPFGLKVNLRFTVSLGGPWGRKNARCIELHVKSNLNLHQVIPEASNLGDHFQAR